MSSRVCGILSSCILSLVSPPNIMLLWSDGKSAAIYVRAGSDTVMSGENIDPPLTRKHDILLYLSHVLLVLYSKRASNYGSNHNWLLSCTGLFQVTSITCIFLLRY